MAIRVAFTKVLVQYNAQRRAAGWPPLSMRMFAEEAGVEYQELRRWAKNRIDSSNHDLLSGVMRRLQGVEIYDESIGASNLVSFNDLFEYIPDDSL